MRRPHAAARARATALAAFGLLAALTAAPAASAATWPASMAATGDSITRAYNTGFFPFTDNAAGSWATGTSGSVSSLYTRLLAVNPSISGRAWNDAKTGAKVADLAGQLTTVAARRVDTVTVLIGANDVCASSEAAMTSVADFTTRFQAGLNVMAAQSPTTVVRVASIPNIWNLWNVLKGSSAARSTWSLFGICKSMLANPTSTAQADVDRRARVLQREQAFNAAMAAACAAHANCRWDGLAVYNVTFTTADVSSRDYFHPSLAGQKKLAATAWSAWFATP